MAKTILSVGLPNSGKSTLFNALTGGQAKVGNWAGVTVAESQGTLQVGDQSIQLVDLPGLYDLTPAQSGPEDEAVSQQALLKGQFDGVVNVIDATQLSRHLYLTAQLRELGIPMVVVLNKWDAACAAGLNVDLAMLEERLGCPVVALSARQSADKEKALQAISTLLAQPQLEPLMVPYGEVVESHLSEARHESLMQLMKRSHDWLNIIASARHQWVAKLLEAAEHRHSEEPSLSERLDKWVLHPVAGIPVFLFMMYLTFMFAIHVGSAFIDFFDIMAGAIFVDGTALALESINAPGWLIGLLANGVGAGIQTVATFIPVVAFLFVALGILETSGYMARAAFVVEGAMQKLGLPGKAFVPLIVGFGCNVPSITATRTLELRRQRIMAGMMAPFMSCGARLPVYALFATAFFPDNGQNLVFLLYVVGIVMAVLTGLMLRHTLLPGASGTTVMELPDYELPTLRQILSRTWQRTRQFVLGAGKVIVVVVTLLSFFNTMGTDGTIGHEDTDSSLLAVASQIVTPAFGPMGIEQDNWPATVGIITGIFAKEAVVGTLSSLYSQGGEDEGGEWDLLGSFNEALATIPEALLGIEVTDPLGLKIGDVHDVDTMAEDFGFETGSLANLEQGFGSRAAAFAYLLFILLYTPCVAVMGAMAQEYGGRWALFAGAWTFGVAYATATLFYQFATFGMGAIGYLLVFAILLGAVFLALRKAGQHQQTGAGDIPIVIQE
ncbi:ferrous iron transport protein B [Ferrimonas balearica]|uniref:ferrous iron transport protein B n=1 Tax=Ferrimonas balearica TaxID=44012 RepID=UPI001C99DB65|nr:ferrous iron transport protein B [Ferrimonas balearica]MBY5920990.1 ferrous iron transport protein B [Ferrimonas balearica]MBY5996325.1 ferrous iron transport protein B [Ferrimonas balearica]